MNTLARFEQFLMGERRSPGTIQAHLRVAARFSSFQQHQGRPADIDQASPEDIRSFVDEASAQGDSIKGMLWSLHNYYRYSGSKRLHDYAQQLRRAAMETEKKHRATPKLSQLEGASAKAVAALLAEGIESTRHLLELAASSSERRRLARKHTIPPEGIEELAFFADLSRITDIKGKRSRFLIEAGIRTVAELRTWNPLELRQHLTRVARDSGRRPPTNAETEYWVQQSRKLPDVLTVD